MVKELQEKEAKHISKEAETQELINRLLPRIENLENKVVGKLTILFDNKIFQDIIVVK